LQSSIPNAFSIFKANATFMLRFPFVIAPSVWGNPGIESAIRPTTSSFAFRYHIHTKILTFAAFCRSTTFIMSAIETEDTIYKLPDSLVKPYLDELFGNPHFLGGLKAYTPEPLFQAILEYKEKINDVRGFQSLIILNILKFIEKNSITALTAGGLEHLKKDDCYLFISNHRDIVLDSAYLNTTLFENGYETSQIAIGDNLMRHRISELIFRLNKSFVIKRSGAPMELYKFSVQLSNYIHDQVAGKQDSIWIAQREGRAKDGNDLTQTGLVKMLCLGNEGDLKEYIRSLNITPVSISYEFNPCDALMAQEFLNKKANPDYKKSFEEDVQHMMLGLNGAKGRVHFQFCPTLRDQLDALDEQPNAKKKLEKLAALIDEAIHANYRLHAVNSVAHDLLHGTRFAEAAFEAEEIAHCTAYLEGKAAQLVNDTDGEGRAYLLGMYANPLVNQLAVTTPS
jgi:hypothetical protein